MEHVDTAVRKKLLFNRVLVHMSKNIYQSYKHLPTQPLLALSAAYSNYLTN